MSALIFLLSKLNTLQKIVNSRSHGVMTVVCSIHTIMTSRRLFRHNLVSRGANQPICRKSELELNKINWNNKPRVFSSLDWMAGIVVGDKPAWPFVSGQNRFEE